MNQFSLAGKTAVITGAARGLGFAFAQALAEAGANIAILDIVEPSEAALFELRSHVIIALFYKTDVTSRENVYDVVAQVERDFGSIDININAAGVVRDEPFLTTSDSTIDFTFGVNFIGSFLVAQACANAMVRKLDRSPSTTTRVPSTDRTDGDHPPRTTTTRTQPHPPTNGSIIFITSIATHISSVAQQISCYSASKSAVRGLVKPLAMELAPHGIRVNSLSPGYMMTDMMRGLQTQQPDLVRQFEKETLFGRIGEPEELKGAALWLASEASRWVTGQDLLVDGGASGWKQPAVLE